MLHVILPEPQKAPRVTAQVLFAQDFISTSTFSERKRLSEIPEETQPPTL